MGTRIKDGVQCTWSDLPGCAAKINIIVNIRLWAVVEQQGHGSCQRQTK